MSDTLNSTSIPIIPPSLFQQETANVFEELEYLPLSPETPRPLKMTDSKISVQEEEPFEPHGHELKEKNDVLLIETNEMNVERTLESVEFVSTVEIVNESITVVSDVSSNLSDDIPLLTHETILNTSETQSISNETSDETKSIYDETQSISNETSDNETQSSDKIQPVANDIQAISTEPQSISTEPQSISPLEIDTDFKPTEIHPPVASTHLMTSPIETLDPTLQKEKQEIKEIREITETRQELEQVPIEISSQLPTLDHHETSQVNLKEIREYNTHVIMDTLKVNKEQETTRQSIDETRPTPQLPAANTTPSSLPANNTPLSLPASTSNTWRQTVTTAVAEYSRRQQHTQGDAPSYDEVMKVLAYRKKMAALALEAKKAKLNNNPVLDTSQPSLTATFHTDGSLDQIKNTPTSSYYKALSVLSSMKKPLELKPLPEKQVVKEPIKPLQLASTPAIDHVAVSIQPSFESSESSTPLIEKRPKNSPDTVKKHKFMLPPPAALFKKTTSSNVFLDGRTDYSSSFWRYLDSPASWMTVYFLLNVSMTLFNKAIFHVFDFQFPWLLTALHSFVSAVGASVAVFWLDRQFKKDHHWEVSPYAPPLSWKENGILLAFSVLYTLNIAVSNISLSMVSLPFHQIIRSTNPAVTVALERVFGGRRPTLETYAALMTVIVGVSLATMGEYQFSQFGMIMTCLGVLLSASKGIMTNRLLVGSLKLHPFDLLRRMAWASLIQCCLMAYVYGEWQGVGYYLQEKYQQESNQVEYNGGQWRRNVDTGDWEYTILTAQELELQQHTSTTFLYYALLINGVLAFLLNFVSFTANKRTSALSMTVAGNVKQAMSIALSVMLFSFMVTPLNGLGILLTLVGGAWYSAIGLRRKSTMTKLLNHS